MRFPNHELIVEPEPKPWWRDLPAQTVVLSADEIEDDFTAVFQSRIRESVKSLSRAIENMMFWEPAREALENGGCRQ